MLIELKRKVDAYRGYKNGRIHLDPIPGYLNRGDKVQKIRDVKVRLNRSFFPATEVRWGDMTYYILDQDFKKSWKVMQTKKT